MVVFDEVLHCLENEFPESLAITADVLRRACLQYFMLHNSGTLDKKDARALKAELDALCRVVSHIEIALKPSNSVEV